MRDKDVLNGVVGKYTDRFDENGANGFRKNDDMEIASQSSAPRPRKCVANGLTIIFFVCLLVCLFSFFGLSFTTFF